MGKPRATHSPEYKAKIVIEMLEGVNTASQIGARENLSPKMLGNWKHEFLQNAHRAFGAEKEELARQAKAREAEEREQSLMAKIGQLTYELDWLKKKYTQLDGADRTENRTYRTGKP